MMLQYGLPSISVACHCKTLQAADEGYSWNTSSTLCMRCIYNYNQVNKKTVPSSIEPVMIAVQAQGVYTVVFHNQKYSSSAKRRLASLDRLHQILVLNRKQRVPVP